MGKAREESSTELSGHSNVKGDAIIRASLADTLKVGLRHYLIFPRHMWHSPYIKLTSPSCSIMSLITE